MTFREESLTAFVSRLVHSRAGNAGMALVGGAITTAFVIYLGRSGRGLDLGFVVVSFAVFMLGGGVIGWYAPGRAAVAAGTVGAALPIVALFVSFSTVEVPLWFVLVCTAFPFGGGVATGQRARDDHRERLDEAAVRLPEIRRELAEIEATVGHRREHAEREP